MGDKNVFKEERHYIVDKNGIEVRGGDSTAFSDWKAFVAYGDQDHYIWLLRDDKKFFLFDTNKLSGPQTERLRKAFRTHTKGKEAEE